MYTFNKYILNLDNWSKTIRGCIKSLNNGAYDVATENIAACKALCENESSFHCCSVDYLTETGRCHLSVETEVSLDNPDDFTAPCYLDGWVFATRLVSGKLYLKSFIYLVAKVLPIKP